MKDELLLQSLEEVAERLLIKVGYDDLRKGEVSTPGGVFTLKGEKRILVHKHLHTREKVDVLLDILSGMDVEDLHLPPAIRERIEKARKRRLGQDTH